jgi:hypothetical protein
VQLITGGLLYANVEHQANSTVNKLGVTFSTTQNTYGTFAFSGGMSDNLPFRLEHLGAGLLDHVLGAVGRA